MADATVTRNEPVITFDQAKPISDAVMAFHTIYRLAILIVDEVGQGDADHDGVALAVAIREMAEKHGSALDACLGRLNSASSWGIFNPASAPREPSHG